MEKGADVIRVYQNEAFLDVHVVNGSLTRESGKTGA